MILVTGATGMFGGAVARSLLERGEPVRALVRDPGKAAALRASGAELVVGDMDQPQTLAPAFAGVRRVFLVSPMDERVEERERAMVAAAKSAGVEFVLKLYGAVKHHGDVLDRLHLGSIDALRTSGMSWALLSPNSVMETSLLSQADSIRQTGAMWGCSGDGRVGVVAADDVAAAGAAVLSGEPEPGRNYEVTGPEAITMAEMAAQLSAALGREVAYNDLPEDVFGNILVEQAGMSREEAEIGVLIHFRAWRRGDADLVTGTVQELTGNPARSVEQWAREHSAAFA
jgi:NAD(P)H dehydrogenase (quinone)